MLSYVFPPAAYVGGHRTARYCKYLPLNGWTPIVVTIDPRHVELRDDELCRHVPAGVSVYRTPDLDPAKWLDWLSRWLSRRRRRPATGSAAATALGASRPERPGGAPQLSRLRRFAERILLKAPDSHVFWVPFAFLWGAWLLTTRRVNVIYSTSPPHSCHLAGLLLATCFRKPFVADFRDPWFVAGSLRAPGAKPVAFEPLQSRFKRAVVSRASKVIAVSPGERDELRAEFPVLDDGRFVYLTNGFDPDDFADRDAGDSLPRRFVLSHTGTIYSGAGREFFAAIELLLRDSPELRPALRVNLAGAVSYHGDDTLERLRRAGVVVSRGFQSHADALRIASASDVLVILCGGDSFLPSHLPAKVFEYMRLGRPILAVTPDGDLSRLLATTGTGIAVRPNDPERLATAIHRLYVRSGQAQKPERPPAAVAAFDRSLLAGHLASVLDAAVLPRRAIVSRPMQANTR